MAKDKSSTIHVDPHGNARFGLEEEGSDFWAKAGKAAFKFGTNEKVLKAGAMLGKLNYLRFTNPLVYVGLEAFNSVRDALIVDAVTGKKSTPMDVAKDAVGMAGFGYVMDMAMMKGGQELLRSKYGSEMVGGAVDSMLSKMSKGVIAPQEGMMTVGDLVAKSMQKFIKPADLSGLKFGAVGAVAGLLYAGLNNKQDGVRGTLFDVVSGAGLVMLGHEMYHHLLKKDEGHESKGVKNFVKDRMNKVKGFESGRLTDEMFHEVQSTDPAQKMTKALDVLLNKTKEGKYLKELGESFKGADLTSISSLFSNHEEILSNLSGLHKRVQQYFSSPNGRKNYSAFLDEAKAGHEIYRDEIAKAAFRDVSSVVANHVDDIKTGVKQAQDLYVKNQEAIHNMLRRAGFNAQDLDTLHKGMTDGLTKTVKKLDDITSKEVVDGPEMSDVTKQAVDTESSKVKTDPKDVKKQSEKAAHNTSNNGKVTTGNTVAPEDVKKGNEFLNRQRKMTGWKEKAKVVGALGLGAFAVATALDISERLDHKQDVSKMTNTEKKNQDKKAHQQRMDQRQQAYGHIDMGQMVTQMFQDRIGHHQMGNAKFAPNQYSIQGQTYTI